MLGPGILPLSIVRGTYFPGQILLCRDGKVAVTGTLSPDVTGLYVPCGNYAGFQLFILEGTPSYFIYFNAVANTYVISATLTDGALTDLFLPASQLLEPTGSYLGTGAYTGTAAATDNPKDLTGFGVESEVRRRPSDELVLPLNPSVTDAVNGEITIPPILSTNTSAIQFVGNFYWDILLKDGDGNRFPPFLQGPFSISDNITQKEPLNA